MGDNDTDNSSASSDRSTQYSGNDINLQLQDGVGQDSIYNPAAGTHQADAGKSTVKPANTGKIPPRVGRQPDAFTKGVPAPPSYLTPSPSVYDKSKETPAIGHRSGQAPPQPQAGTQNPTAPQRSGYGSSPSLAQAGTPTPIATKPSGHRLKSDPKGDWSYPHQRWNTDAEIVEDWKTLERMIQQYVDHVFVTHNPAIDTTHLVYPYEALCKHSDLAGPISRNPKYAKYLFQLSIWNVLNLKYLGHMSTEWACEERGRSWVNTRTKGLAEAIFRNTWDQAVDRANVMAQRVREKFYIWRRDSVDLVYGWLAENEDYEKSVENAIFDILGLWQGDFSTPWKDGDRHNWDSLVYRTTEIVAFAAELSIIMRRSRDGTWSPFIPIRGTAVVPAAIVAHQDRAAAFPAGQTRVKPDSAVAMTVVPGLSKYEMRQVADDPSQPGVVMTQIFKRVRVKAKCLIDLTEADTGPRLDGDMWTPEDL
ncbi:unnamed protein product [Discula destructiva]